MLDTLGAIFSGGGSAVLGGLTGILGGVVQKFYDYKKMKLAALERGKDREHELAVIKSEASIAKDMAVISADKEEMMGEIRLREESYRHDEALLPADSKLSTAQLWVLVVVDAFSRFIRPISTLYFQALTTALGIWAGVLLWKAGSDAISAAEVMPKVVDMVLYLTTASTTWWFGIRGPSRRKQ